jgi:hypothetical protein
LEIESGHLEKKNLFPYKTTSSNKSSAVGFMVKDWSDNVSHSITHTQGLTTRAYLLVCEQVVKSWSILQNISFLSYLSH